MQEEGQKPCLASKSTQAQGQQASGSPRLDTNSLWVLTEKEGITERLGVHPLAKLLRAQR